MGYVDDYLGGYENLYRYTDDNNKLDFEGAYMSGLDGYGLESSSWGGLDAWGADDAALYKVSGVQRYIGRSDGGDWCPAWSGKIARRQNGMVA